MIKIFDKLFKNVSLKPKTTTSKKKVQPRKPRINLSAEHQVLCFYEGKELKIHNINQGGIAFYTKDFKQRPVAGQIICTQLEIEKKSYPLEFEIIYVRNHCGAKILKIDTQAVNHLLKYLKIEIAANNLYHLNPSIVKQESTGNMEMYLGLNCELNLKYFGDLLLEFNSTIDEEYIEYTQKNGLKVGKVWLNEDDPFKYKNANIIEDSQASEHKEILKRFEKFISNVSALSEKEKIRILSMLKK